MEEVKDRQAELRSFEEARQAFTEAIASAPEEALGYLKPGDDYALGGLVFHVNAVLQHYGAVLDAVLDADFTPVTPADPPGLFETANARAKEGLLPEQRAVALDEVKRQHDTVAASLSAVPDPDWRRQAAVSYSPGADPFPTSPADITGWLTDHYLEHVPHVSQLLADWRTTR